MIQIILLFINEYNEIYFYQNWKDETNYEIYTKERFIEYKRCDYKKLKMICNHFSISHLYFQFTFYSSLFPNSNSILQNKIKYIHLQSTPPFLLSNSNDFHFIDFIPLKYYVISLQKRVDRRINIEKNMKKHKIQFEYFDGMECEYIDSQKMNRNKSWKKSEKYLKGALGCKLSHLYLLKRVSFESSYICIMEDDFHFHEYENIELIINNSIQELKNKEIDWNILYLTLTLQKRIEQNNNFQIIEIQKNDGLSTACYIIHPSKINEMIYKIENNDIEIDRIYSEDVDKRYCIYPFLGYQSESYSDILHQNVHYETNL